MVPQLISWGSIIVKTLGQLTDDSSNYDKVVDKLDKASNVYNLLSTNSSSRAASRALISPLTLFEDSLTHQDYMVDLMTIVNLRDIRDVLTHINYQSKVGGVKIGELVDQINPNRTAGLMCLQGCEAFNSDIRPTPDTSSTDVKVGNPQIRADEFRELAEYAPLALGRVVNASVSVDGKETTFPLTFRQIPVPARRDDLLLMFQAVKGGAGFVERVKDYKSGGITLPELLTGVDDIRREFRILTKDMSSYYAETLKREANNRRAALATGKLSLNSVANTVIMTKDTADEIELEIGIRFGSSKMGMIRRHVRANTIVVVNDSRGIFEFYSGYSNMSEKYTLSQIKLKNKKEDAGTLESLVKLLSGR